MRDYPTKFLIELFQDTSNFITLQWVKTGNMWISYAKTDRHGKWGRLVILDIGTFDGLMALMGKIYSDAVKMDHDGQVRYKANIADTVRKVREMR